MASVSLSFDENSENVTNVERQNNKLELLDVTTEKHSSSDFMPSNSENHIFWQNNYKILLNIYALVIIQTPFQNLWKTIFQL